MEEHMLVESKMPLQICLQKGSSPHSSRVVESFKVILNDPKAIAKGNGSEVLKLISAPNGGAAFHTECGAVSRAAFDTSK
ncbi:hypothetical protein TorRG33x02_286780 [Trema orientale]|uniref:Uncharacterized protein n=1 Tax=Trema orientale TaxID=63057 RepID=A0A2P5CFR4_TREOI|nr:hypothetical protein TorRG33x02_286780 [Trema orientale]